MEVWASGYVPQSFPPPTDRKERRAEARVYTRLPCTRLAARSGGEPPLPAASLAYGKFPLRTAQKKDMPTPTKGVDATRRLEQIR